MTEEDPSLSTMRTGAKALALLAGSALALTACATSSSGGGPPSSAGTTSAPITVTLGYAQEFSAYNPNTSDGSALANTIVLGQVLRSFYYFAPDGTLTPDTEFGSYEKTSDNPLTIKYTFSDKAVWSDGKPVDCDDAVLMWLANSGLTGEKGFSAATTAGFKDMNKPDCKAGDKTFTVVYKTPFADWAGQFGGSTFFLPAHVVEQQAGMTKTFIDYADTPTSPDLAKAIDFYNKGWQLNPGQLKKDAMPSAGTYMIDSWTAGQSLTLKPNPQWWGPPPKASAITIRYIADTAQAQALQNGEVNIMEPQPQVDIVNQLKALGDKVKTEFGDQFSFEHLDFNYKGEFKNADLRQAFAKCVPRQQILDNLIKPQNPQAKVIESRFVFPFQDAYAGFATSVGGQAYDTVDIAAAKAAVAKSGVKTPIQVRIGWKKDPAALNKRRADTVALMQASCKAAGFNVVDAGTPTFFTKEWPSANFDVALFAWIGSPLVSGNDDIYKSGGGQNPGGYANPQVDALITQLDKELDKDKQVVILKQLDTILWKDLGTIPLFAFPAVVATDTKVENVKANATQADITWNAYAWNLKQ
jgi:peptide/nickel transport system substrate-binding protein